MRERVLVLAGLAVLVASPAAAHPGSVGHGLAGGFVHPFSGGDHIVTMVALGALSLHLGRRARWLLPHFLVLGMAAGGVLAAWGVLLPGLEAIIVGSAALLAATAVSQARVAPRIIYILAAVAAVINGYLHIGEMPGGVPLFPYAAGLVCASGALYRCGTILQRLFWPQRSYPGFSSEQQAAGKHRYQHHG